ncbi:hypothetical protein LWI29_028588 [Acer saccharum]|uniref:Uncharacterized protein n=1 Tax=Acer saccharum TaxID=4024 RepID=A0AA39S762_ACESA|nr:hypothetical protein LWI29_028588 [Acer saccharum]KAK1562925.1 hypothetical protein Q3G72_019206 [Acer saccharum]
MAHKRKVTMNFDGLDDDDIDDRFFETSDRISSVMPLDLASSGSDEEDEDFEDSRMSFASTMSTVHRHEEFRNFATSTTANGFTPMSPDYNIWMAAPGSITERRKRLLQDMGLSKEKDIMSFKRGVSNKFVVNGQTQVTAAAEPVRNNCNGNVNGQVSDEKPKQETTPNSPAQTPPPSSSLLPVVVVRSRSEGDIESLCVDKERKEEMIGTVSKQRLTRTSSMIHARICPYQDPDRVVAVAAKESGTHRSVPSGAALTSMMSNLGAFFLIKNLDTGKEFIVNEYNEDGMWNRLSDLQTGKQLTMEEFEKSVGFSPVVKELMRRENVSTITEDAHKFSANSYLSKSLRMSKRRGAALLKNIKGVANSMSLRSDKDREHLISPPPLPLPPPEAQQKQSKNSSSNSNEWVKVRQTGKSYKELSALHLCQEIQAHEGSIWTIKFSYDTRYMASAGEDKVIHLWEVQECEVTSMNNEGNMTPLHPSMSPIHPSMCSSPDRTTTGSVEGPPKSPVKKKKGKGNRKGDTIPDYVHVPETVFGLSEKPICSFKGHTADVLDLSWSKSQLLLSSSMDKTVRLWDIDSKTCLKVFTHSDFVTSIQFNPMDDDYFISGSLDAKVRMWSIPDRLVVDWTDLHEMVTAVCYAPDGQAAFIGSHKGICRMYNTQESTLDQENQIEFQSKKKSQAKKITGFQFSPSNPSEVLVTSADSRIRIMEGSEIVQTLRGFRNTSSQISASYSSDGKYIVCASEDFQVYFWKREEHRSSGPTGKKRLINTRSHEHFQCRDVSVAIVWPGTVKGDPPPMPVHSKRHSKRNGSQSQPSSANGSPTRDEGIIGFSKRLLPPLPKKNNKTERASTPSEEDLAQISRSNSGIGDSFGSNFSSIRYGDSPSISAADANSSSIRHDDSPSILAASGPNSALIRHDDSPSISAATCPNSASIRHDDSPSISAATCPNSASVRHDDSPSISAATGPNSASASVRHDDSPSISASTGLNSASVRHGDSPSILTATGPNSASVRNGDSPSISAATGPNSASIRHGGDSSFSSFASSWSLFDGGNQTNQTTVQTTAWGLVIVTATVGGQIRSYQNFGLPRRMGHKGSLF